jgi:hypothetical protein
MVGGDTVKQIDNNIIHRTLNKKPDEMLSFFCQIVATSSLMVIMYS